MSSLQALQQQLLQAVLADTTPALDSLRGDQRAQASTRLDIYRHGYRVRLRDALAVEYPGLGLMARRRFQPLLQDYVEAHPSGHYNIRWHGAGLAAFLDYGRPWRDRPELAEMARLDWAISTVFDAADEPVLGLADMAVIPPESWPSLTLVPQSNLQLVETRYNIEAFRRAADRDLARPRLRQYSTPRTLLVWRQDMAVHYRSLDQDEITVLREALAGKPFAELCESLEPFHGEDAAMERMALMLHGWVTSGLLRSCNFPRA